MATEDIMSALDGDIRPNGIDVCQAEKFRFISMYWMEIWRNVRSNYLNTRFCTQLDVDVLNKLSVTSADKMIAFLFDARHSFVPMFDVEQILSFEKSIPAGGGIY